MARAEYSMKGKLNRAPQPQARRLAVMISRALLLPLLASTAQAQSQPPTPLPTDVRYTPVNGSATKGPGGR